jgi:type II secretory pathway component PulJ
MRMARSRLGLSVVELLVVAALLGVVLTILVNFFVQQSQVTRRTQARNEVEVNVRTAAEIIIQDLQVAGSRVIFNGGVANDVQLGCTGSSCLKKIAADRFLTVYYATSLQPSAPCRRVDYKLTSTQILQRVEQGGTACGGLGDPTTSTFNLNPLAQNVTAISIVYQCADDALNTPNPPADPAACYAGNSFPRQATVNVRGRSTAFADVSAGVTLTTSIPNAKF